MYKNIARSFTYMLNIIALVIGVVFRKPIALFYGIYAFIINYFINFLKFFSRNYLYAKKDKLIIRYR